MKIEINLKDAIVFALILAIIVIGGIKITKIETQLQNAVLFKTVSNHEAAIQQIVAYLNGKAAGPNAPVKPPVQAPPTK